MELKAPTVGDVRLWVKALQNASKGIVPAQPKVEVASTPEPPPMVSATPAAPELAPEAAAAETAAPAEAAAVESPAESKWMKVATEDGEPYYYDEVSGTTSWEVPPGFIE